MADKEKVILNREQFPSNSIVKSETTETVVKVERPKVKKLATAKRIKKPFHKRFANAFLEGEPAREVGDYIVHDVIIPAAKSTIADLIEGAIDMLLFGGQRRTGRGSSPYSRDRGRSHVPYNSMHERSNSVSSSRSRNSRATTAEPTRGRWDDISDVIFTTRTDAETVLAELDDTIANYEVARVSDFFEMAGVSSSYTDQKWGWTDLSATRVINVRGGWVIDLPRPVVIN